jgi:hypothetical protein
MLKNCYQPVVLAEILGNKIDDPTRFLIIFLAFDALSSFFHHCKHPFCPLRQVPGNENAHDVVKTALGWFV